MVVVPSGFRCHPVPASITPRNASSRVPAGRAPAGVYKEKTCPWPDREHWSLRIMQRKHRPSVGATWAYGEAIFWETNSGEAWEAMRVNDLPTVRGDDRWCPSPAQPREGFPNLLHVMTPAHPRLFLPRGFRATSLWAIPQRRPPSRRLPLGRQPPSIPSRSRDTPPPLVVNVAPRASASEHTHLGLVIRLRFPRRQRGLVARSPAGYQTS